MSAGAAAAPYRGRWILLWMLVFVRVAMGYQYQSATTASLWLVDAFKVDYASIGGLIGFYTLPGIVIALPGGFIAWRLGEKNMLLFGLALMTLGGALSGIGSSYDMVFWGRMIAACGVVLLFVVMTKAVGDWFSGGERFLAMALFLNGWPLGIALGLFVQPLIGESWNWHWIFHTSAIGTGVVFLAMLATFRHPPGYDSAAPAASGAQRIAWRAVVLVIVSGLAWAFVNGGHMAIVSFGTAFLETRGYSKVGAGQLLSLNMWGVIAGVMIGGWFTSRFPRPVAFTAITTFLGAAAAFAFPFAGEPLIWIVLAGLFAIMGAGVMAALPIEVLTPSNRAFGLGLFYAWWYAGFAAGPALAGWVRDLTGDPKAPLLFGACMMGSTSLLLGLFRFLQRRWPEAR